MSSPLTLLADFPDKLSPMLVKELRQGMRARSFTLLFLAFQGILGFILLTVSTNMSEGSGSFASGLIFTMFGIATLIVQPMRGINALSAEITSNTIEMMALTRLTASRIVYGKWIAIVSQTTLILITIIPYLILRYFLGGMILVGELVFLALMFLTSVTLTAALVGLSGTTSKIVKALPTLAIIFMAMSAPGILFGYRGGNNNMMSFFALNDWPSRIAVLSYVCFISYLGWCALSYGISAIAPVAENHSTLRRVIALALAGIAVAVGFHPEVDPMITTVILAIIVTPAVIVALTEPSALLPPIYKPFLKRGAGGKLASIFLLPGWPAGVFYTALLVTISAAGIFFCNQFRPTPDYPIEVTIVCLSCLGSILLPALLTSHFSKEESKRFTNFIVFLLASAILMIIPGVLVNIDNNEEFLWLFIWNPPTFLMMVDERQFDHSDLLVAVIVVDCIIAGLLLLTAARAFRGYGHIFQETEHELASAPPLETP